MASTPVSSQAARSVSRAGKFPWMSLMRARRIVRAAGEGRRRRRSIVGPMRSPGGRRAGLWRLGAAAVAAVVVAEAAAWALRPRDDVIDPLPIAEDEYFDPAQVERAEDYRSGQRLLFIATLGIETGLLVALALGRPRAVRRRLD